MGHRYALVGQRGAGQSPAVVDLPDDHLVGHEHVVEEHLVEQVVAGDLAQRPDIDARRFHVDEEVRDALVLRRVGVGARQAHTPLSPVRPRRPHLLPGEPPTTLGANGFHAQRGKVGTGAGLAEQLAPEQLTAQRGGTNRSTCSGLPCSRIVGAAHQPMTRSGRVTPAAAISWSISSCSAGPAARPYGRGQCGASRPGFGQRHLLLFGRQCRDFGYGRGDFGLKVGPPSPGRCAARVARHRPSATRCGAASGTGRRGTAQFRKPDADTDGRRART